mmetsp:Transcript_12010/g.39128  ORF Transcript_12010/g.39128 Transcript_12010/m.39128 type:complete len:357 (-) Transcript_12010:8-1078(-)
MGPEVASFLGFASTTRARRVSKAWRRILGDDLAKQPKDLQMSSHSYASPIYNIRDDTFDGAFESVSWRPQVLIVQCNLGGRRVPCQHNIPMEEREEFGEYDGYGSVAKDIWDERYNLFVWLPKLMDVLRARVPPDCYIVAKTFQTAHKSLRVGRNFYSLETVNSPLFVSCVVLRAAKSMPRPSVFALSAPSIRLWNSTTVFGREPYGYSHLDDAVQLPESTVEFQCRVNETEPLVGREAEYSFLEAWRREISLRRAAPTSRPMLRRCALRSWEGNAMVPDPGPGLLAGVPSNLRIVKWWFLAIEHRDLPRRMDASYMEQMNAGQGPILEETSHGASRWSRLYRALAQFMTVPAPPA